LNIFYIIHRGIAQYNGQVFTLIRYAYALHLHHRSIQLSRAI